MKYEVRLSRRADKELSSLNPSVRNRIVPKLEELGEDPFLRGIVKLQGREGLYRVRIGDYRILYRILVKEKQVLVEKIDHRSGVYGP